MRDPAVIPFPADRADEVVDVLVDAFHDYPVMRHVIGDAGADYDTQLTSLMGFFVAARLLRDEPMIGVTDGGRLVATAIMTPPGTRESPPELDVRRETMWAELGPDARARYEHLGEQWRAFAVPEPNLHLNAIGVRRSHARKGLGRRLLDAVHAMSAADPASCGVTLSTEDPANVAWYEGAGYEIVGHLRITADLETWGFYRPDAPA